ncbi:MAG: hypothetical protein CO108_30155 [Deltaproteobacteria bacterium CG_4_9_14_3_um_filter_63_12]|nr:MAG: hypothetical protein CO108_30155 [Deltaproteobacteria bacterium CG_4_9_14_3_um_filter_63_12]
MKSVRIHLGLFLVALFVMASVAACGHTPPRGTGAALGESGKGWEQTLDQVVKGVVVLRISVPRDFDTEFGGSYLGTGFVVDAERGIILTNRHLVQPGPVVAEAVFLNHEEVDLRAIYRDPVHDFGFYQYDPADLRFTEVNEIPLAPEAARVGIDVKIVGNDGGEKLSILNGTLARLDRDAPAYDGLSYNDFNTFYFQAASGTSGGSSGSPVIDIEGRAVALNAGGAFMAETSYFLPLDRVVRALHAFQEGKPVTRGTIQTVFKRQSFDELRRLGLPLELEKQLREVDANTVGLLVVDEVVPGGPGAEALEPGDILLSIEGEPVLDFVTLETHLDGSVGDLLKLVILKGSREVEVELRVGDLHAITPSEYVEVGSAVIHPLSYQQARNFREPVRGLYLARPGYLFGGSIPWGSLIKSIDGRAVNTVDELWAVLLSLDDRARIRVRYAVPFDSAQEQIAVVYLDRRWFPLQRCTREDATGKWPCEAAPPATGVWTPEPRTVASTAPESGVEAALADSMVMVEFDVPYFAEGAAAAHYVGAGLVVDAAKGLVVTDRDTASILLGDAQLTFGTSLRIPAKVVFLHPTQNFAVIQYDPALVGDTPVKSARFDDTPLAAHDKLWLVGREADYDLVSNESTVTRIAPILLPLPDYPAFRASNLDVVEVSAAPSTVGGVLANADGSVRALWGSFGFDDKGPVFAGTPTTLVGWIVDDLVAGKPVVYRSLGVELHTLNLADAREAGLSDARIDDLEKRPPAQRQVMYVVRRYSGFPSELALEGGDIIVAAEGRTVSTFEELEKIAQDEDVALVVIRDGKELEVSVKTKELSNIGVDRIVSWAGLLLHEPHLAVAAQRSTDVSGVYITYTAGGSPASHYMIDPVQRIIEVDDIPTPDLDAFMQAISGEEDRQSVRLKVMDLEGMERMLTLRTDFEFWPTWELRYDGTQWTRTEH